MSRLGAALIGAGDGLRRIDTGEWQGDAADSFRRVFEPVPPLWTGTGEAFLEAADALAEYADVLEGARDDAATAVQEWAAEPGRRRRPAPGRPDRGLRGAADRAAASWRTPAISPRRRRRWPSSSGVSSATSPVVRGPSSPRPASSSGRSTRPASSSSPLPRFRGGRTSAPESRVPSRTPRRPSRRRSTRARRPPTPPAGPARCSPARDSPPSAVPVLPDGSNAPPAPPGRCRPAHQGTAATRPHPSGATTA